MRKLYLPLRWIRRLAFYWGINTEPRAFVCSFPALALLPLPPSVVPCRRRISASALMAGKS
jgi:hypothetical protein